MDDRHRARRLVPIPFFDAPPGFDSHILNPLSGSAAQSMSARPESGVLRCRKLRVASVDDLICSHKHCCGYCQTECFQGFLVNDETEVGWLLEWEIGGARSS